MKAILMSIKPKYVAKILNKEKTIEVRKRFPKDYVGWVYIYCTKNDYENVFGRKQKIYLCDMRGKTESGFDFMTLINNEDNEKFIKDNLNGKVVARFWCYKVEGIKRMYLSWNDNLFAWETETLSQGELEIKACLETKELRNYLAFKENGYAIHITKLEIFDKPKELSEFKHLTCGNCKTQFIRPLSRAPQSFCYIEI